MKCNIISILNWSRLENISFLESKGTVSRVTKKIQKLVEEVDNQNKLLKLADMSQAGWPAVREYLFNDLASDSEDKKRVRTAKIRALAKE